MLVFTWSLNFVNIYKSTGHIIEYLLDVWCAGLNLKSEVRLDWEVLGSLDLRNLCLECMLRKPRDEV